MKKLTLFQASFLNHLLNSNFKEEVLKLSKSIGSDGAFYMCLGAKQSETGNFSFDDLTDSNQEKFVDAIIDKMPELEF
jgi:hypothetical protein